MDVSNESGTNCAGGSRKLLDHCDLDKLYRSRCQVLCSLHGHKGQSASAKQIDDADTEQNTLVKEAGFDDVMWRCIDLHALFADSPRIFQSTLPQSRHVFCRQAPTER